MIPYITSGISPEPATQKSPGVETLDQLEALRTLGGDFAQGYFIAPPMSPSDISKLLADDTAGLRLIGPNAVRGNTRNTGDAEAMLLELLKLTHQPTEGARPPLRGALAGRLAASLARAHKPLVAE